MKDFECYDKTFLMVVHNTVIVDGTMTSLVHGRYEKYQFSDMSHASRGEPVRMLRKILRNQY